MSRSEATVHDVIGAALNAERPDIVVAAVEAALASSDGHERWVVNACVLAMGHMARRFGEYPGKLKTRIWERARTIDAAEKLAGTLEDAEADIAHFKARPV